MTTPATSAQWVVSFKRQSTVDQETYTISISNTTPETTVRGVARQLEKQGYVDVHQVFAVVLPP